MPVEDSAWRTALTAGPVPPVLHAAPGTTETLSAGGSEGYVWAWVCVQYLCDTHSLSANLPFRPCPCNLPFRPCPDAKVAFAGDEGAGIQIAVEGGVYAEEERW